MITQFKPAVRKQVKLKLALTGPSGSGKTMSALLIASGMGSKVAVIDTENESASLYAEKFNFDTLCITAPYTVHKYIEAIKAAEQAGYDVLVVDSLSHAWVGEGGLLAKKESLDARGGNSFANWAAIGKEHEMLKSAILNSQIHMICTMRSKQEYAQEKDDRGKTVIKKLGMAPQQREGLEFEFAVVFDLGMDHHAVVSKDRSSLFDGQIFKPTKGTGEALMSWLQRAKVTPIAEAVEAPSPQPVISPDPIRTCGVKCSACQSELVLHKSGAGYLCPNSKAPNDGHLRFPVAKLAEFQARQSA